MKITNKYRKLPSKDRKLTSKDRKITNKDRKLTSKDRKLTPKVNIKMTKYKRHIIGGGGRIYTDEEISYFNTIITDMIRVFHQWSKKMKKPLNKIDLGELTDLQHRQIEDYIENIIFIINIDNKDEKELENIFTFFCNLYDREYSTEIEKTGITNKILLEKYTSNKNKYQMVRHLFISKINRKRLAIFTDYSNAQGVSSQTIIRRRMDRDIGKIPIIKYILEKVDKKIEDLMYQNIKSVDRETYSNQQLIDYYYLQQFINIE